MPHSQVYCRYRSGHNTRHQILITRAPYILPLHCTSEPLLLRVSPGESTSLRCTAVEPTYCSSLYFSPPCMSPHSPSTSESPLQRVAPVSLPACAALPGICPSLPQGRTRTPAPPAVRRLWEGGEGGGKEEQSWARAVGSSNEPLAIVQGGATPSTAARPSSNISSSSSAAVQR